MVSSSNHVSNLNCALKGIKPDIFIDFICKDHWGLIIMLYQHQTWILLKNIKILDLYLLEETNTPIDASMVKTHLHFQWHSHHL